MQKPDSKLLYVSTRDAHTRSSDGSTYTINMPNAHSINKTVSLVPMSVTLDNMFTNVNGYNNEIVFYTSPVAPIGTVHSVTVDQYSNTELATAWNTLYGALAGLTFTLTGTKFEFGSCGGQYITAPLDHWRLLGFQDQVVKVIDDTYSLTLPGSGTLTASTHPNLGGEKLVNIVVDEMGHSNCVHSKDGMAHDVIAHISFADTAYGNSATWRAGDTETHSIEFKNHKNMNNLVVEIRDHHLRPINLPSNYHLKMYFKVYHRDY